MAAGDWIMCDCCDGVCENAGFEDGGSLECSVGRFYQQTVSTTFVPPAEAPEHPCDPFNCTIAYYSICFPTEELAEDFVGVGNFDPITFTTPDWLLFFTPSGGDGAGTFARDASRPVDLEIDVEPFTFAHPTFGFSTRRWLVPVEIRLASTWTWNRVSLDPDDPNFKKWELTDGEVPDGAATECIGMKLQFFNAGLVWDDATFGPDLVAEFTADAGDGDCCPRLDDIDPCLGYQGDATEVDGWQVGGSWASTIGGEVLQCANGADDGSLVTSVNFHGEELTGSSTCVVATASHLMTCPPAIPGGAECTSSKTWTLECIDREDVKVLPDAETFTESSTTGNCEDHTFDSLTEDDCDETHGEDNCPPDECPLSYCRWVWDVESDVWVLDFSNCVEPAECPGAPTDPPGPGDPLVICVCCSDINPPLPCDPGFEPCLTQDCVWWWQGTWELLTPCSDITCECQGQPDDLTDPGGFIGELRQGTCCIEI
jgi:hypothetical protein